MSSNTFSLTRPTFRMRAWDAVVSILCVSHPALYSDLRQARLLSPHRQEVRCRGHRRPGAALSTTRTPPPRPPRPAAPPPPPSPHMRANTNRQPRNCSPRGEHNAFLTVAPICISTNIKQVRRLFSPLTLSQEIKSPLVAKLGGWGKLTPARKVPRNFQNIYLSSSDTADEVTAESALHLSGNVQVPLQDDRVLLGVTRA